MGTRACAWLFITLPLIGCSGDSNSISNPPSPSMLVLGDATANGVLEQLRSKGFSASNDRALLPTAAVVIVAQDAASGPTDVHRQIIQEISRMGNNKLLWILTNCHAISDVELLELEELEVREMLNQHGLPGDTATVARDGASSGDLPGPSLLIGWPQIERHLSELGMR